MPPIQRSIAIVTTGNYASEVLTFDAPSVCKKGDRILLFIGGADIAGKQDPGPSTDEAWSEVLLVSGPNAGGTADMVALVCERTFDPNEPGLMSIELVNGPAAITWCAIVYRGVQDIVSPTEVNVTNSTNWPCPSISFVEYSGVLVGVAASDGTATNFTAPGAERFDSAGSSLVRLLVFDLAPEAAGATGVKTATSAAAKYGACGSLGLVASGLVGSKSLSGVSPVSGMLGLPTRGV